MTYVIRSRTTVTSRHPLRGGYTVLGGPTVRGGLSLMEVLVSVFVLSIGVLGVLSALPIGGFAVQKAKIADRSAACGRAALSEIRIRGWNDPDRLANLPTSTFDAFAVDPLFLARASTAGKSGFPYQETSPLMRRATISGTPPYSTVIPPALAERLFLWEDQIEHTRATEDETRPRMMVADGRQLSKPEFSWMWTAVPKTWDQSDRPTSYEVSVVVFFKRDLDPEAMPTDDPPTERAVTCAFPGDGTGGGDVTLSADRGIDLDLRDIEYVMLHTTVPRPGGTRTVCHWYKIVGQGEIEPALGGGYQRHVSLQGPDWRYRLSSGIPQPCAAVLCTGVCAVYTTTMSAENNPLW